MRRTFASVSSPVLRQTFEWADVTDYHAFVAETLDASVWGGAMQIAVAAATYGVTIRVHAPWAVQSYGSGEGGRSYIARGPVRTTMWRGNRRSREPVRVGNARPSRHKKPGPRAKTVGGARPIAQQDLVRRPRT